MNDPKTTQYPAAPLIRALHAGSCHAPLADQLNLFGQFVGAWELEWLGPDPDGQARRVKGELTFGWVLDGRAIQDVWKVPADPADAHGLRGFHGTTLRFFDPAIDAWRSTWLDPLNGRVRRFIGRPGEGGIVLESLDDPCERWRFCDITSERFRWLGESSRDGGRTWVAQEEMHACRLGGAGSGRPTDGAERNRQ